MDTDRSRMRNRAPRDGGLDVALNRFMLSRGVYDDLCIFPDADADAIDMTMVERLAIVQMVQSLELFELL